MMREYDINLIPDDVLERETLIERGRMWLFIAGGVLIFLLALNLAIKILNNYSSKEIAALSSGDERGSGEMSQSNSDLAAMLAELSENEIYTSVNLKYSRSGDTEDGMPVSFEIECMLSNVSQAGE